MMWEVRESAAAAHDLEEALAYLSSSLANPSAAENLLARYGGLLDLLEKSPLALPLVRDHAFAQAGCRWAHVGSYLCFFVADEKERHVLIIRLLHGSRNWRALL